MYRNSVTFDTFVTHKETVPYENSSLMSCTKVLRQPHGKYTVNGMLYSQPIQSVFIARDVPFMQMNNKLFSCTTNYKQCHELVDLDGDVLCSVKE